MRGGDKEGWLPSSPTYCPHGLSNSFVEQSNAILEQRNESFKTTASQAQVKVLHLEQEKVGLHLITPAHLTSTPHRAHLTSTPHQHTPS